LLHSGTNGASTSTKHLAAILDEIDRYEVDFGNPITVVVAQIILRRDIPARITAYN
jgi:hypothetical protein